LVVRKKGGQRKPSRERKEGGQVEKRKRGRVLFLKAQEGLGGAAQ